MTREGSVRHLLRCVGLAILLPGCIGLPGGACRIAHVALSRWLVTPMAVTSDGAKPTLVSEPPRRVATTLCPELLRVVLDPAGGAGSAETDLAVLRDRSACPSSSTTRHSWCLWFPDRLPRSRGVSMPQTHGQPLAFSVVTGACARTRRLGYAPATTPSSQLKGLL